MQKNLVVKKRRQNVIADHSPRLYYASFFLVCGCQISTVQILESELRCYMNTLSARCFLILSNMATMRTRSLLIVEAPPAMI